MDNLRNIDFGTGTNRTYNMVALGAFGLAIFCGIIFCIMLILPAPQQQQRALPQQLEIPTLTPSLTPTITRTPFPATFTPTFTPTFTLSPAPSMTFTAIPSVTVSHTPTITTTAQASETPTETPTLTETEGPPPTSPPPFLFDIQSPPQFVANTFNTAGCAWQGIGGQVLNVGGEGAYTNTLNVRVFGSDLPADQKTTTGSNTKYGTSGFEVQIANSINTSTYFIQLESQFGTPVSDRIQVTFPGACEQNVAIVTFVLLRAP